MRWVPGGKGEIAVQPLKAVAFPPFQQGKQAEIVSAMVRGIQSNIGSQYQAAWTLRQAGCRFALVGVCREIQSSQRDGAVHAFGDARTQTGLDHCRRHGVQAPFFSGTSVQFQETADQSHAASPCSGKSRYSATISGKHVHPSGAPMPR